MIYKNLYFILIFALSFDLFGQSIHTIDSVPNPRTEYAGFVSDPDQNLNAQDLQALNAELIGLELDTTAEFAIVILGSIGDKIPKEFAVELFNKWGIGKKGKDNGLLLLLVMDQRRWEFETGYGLEGDLPDAILKRIGEEKLVPKLREKNMAVGLTDVIRGVTRRIKKEPEIDSESNDSIQDSLPIDLEYDDYYSRKIFAKKLFYKLLYFTPFYALLFYFGGNFLGNRKGAKNSILFSKSILNWKLIILGLIPFFINFLVYTFFFNYSYILILILPIYIFISVSCLFYMFHHYRNLDQAAYRDPYEYYKKIDLSFRSWELILLSLLIPVPSLFFIGYCFFKRKKLRLTERICPSCKVSMIRLDEEKDDFFLKDGQKIEEKIGSVDYDVWFCENSKDVKIYAYESLFTSFSNCPACKFKTYFVESDTVTVSPTCSSSGKGIRRFACKHCPNTKSSTYTIPARDCSKSSGSSSSSYSSYSSSSSGSSFGGGSSGGGGAGGSW